MIDIIIPVYNVEKYLEKCIQSVLSQSYTDYHIILVDDGSKDSSGTICDLAAEKNDRITVIHKKNGGLSSARNAGIDASTGDYVLFLDSDDTLTENALQTLMNAMQAGGVDAVFGGYRFVDEEGSILQTLTVPEQVLSEDMRFSLVYEQTHMVMSCGKLFRRELLSGFRFREGRLHEDVFAYHELVFHAKKIYCIEEPIINYLQRSDSITGKAFSVRNFDAVDALFERVSFFAEKGLEQCRETTIQYIFKYLIYIIHRIDFHNPEISAMYTNYYCKWKTISGASHDRAFRLLCFLYGKGLLKKPLLDYSVFWILKRTLLLFHARSVVLQLLSNWSVKPRFILISTPVHGNLGDQAIVYSQLRFLKDCGIRKIVEIKSVDYLRYRSVICRLIPRKDVIIIDGGGNIGSLWPTEAERINDIVKRFRANPIIIFPETAFFSEDAAGLASLHNTKKAFESHENLHVFLRDEPSYRRMREMLPDGNVYLCPDIVLYLKGKLKTNTTQREDVFLCMRGDVEKNIPESAINEIVQAVKDKNLGLKHGDTEIDRYVTAPTREDELEKKWNEFSSSKLVITDRLHGMLFAYITNTPCLAFNNVNGKVLSQYHWIKQAKSMIVVDDSANIKESIDILLAEDQVLPTENGMDYSQLKGVILRVKQHG